MSVCCELIGQTLCVTCVSGYWVGRPRCHLFLPSTVPILLVSTESVWSSQPPPHRPSLKRLRMDWLESITTRIHSAAVTVLEWRCSSMNISSQSKPSVRTSSSHALRMEEEVDGEEGGGGVIFSVRNGYLGVSKIDLT